jgi:hypothetical protein
VRRDRALGWLGVIAGLGLAVGVQVASPVRVPLYDGVGVLEPYRYLHPGSGQSGFPASYTASTPVEGGKSPQIAAATTESPPQAQLIAMVDAFQLPDGTTEVKTSITPVDPSVQPATGAIAGNVYRISVTTQDNRPLVPKPCDTCRTLVLRGPDQVTDGSIVYLDGQNWVPISSGHGGIGSMIQTNLNLLGDYAVLTGSSGGGGGLDLLVFGGIALALFFAVVAGLFWYRRRPPPVPVARLGPGRGRVPSKRKGPRRPPSGRSDS